MFGILISGQGWTFQKYDFPPNVINYKHQTTVYMM